MYAVEVLRNLMKFFTLNYLYGVLMGKTSFQTTPLCPIFTDTPTRFSLFTGVYLLPRRYFEGMPQPTKEFGCVVPILRGCVSMACQLPYF